MANKFSEHFATLEDEGEALLRYPTNRSDHPFIHYDGGDQKHLAWRLRAENLIIQSCGENNVYIRDLKATDGMGYVTSVTRFPRWLSAFSAARADYDNGIFKGVRNLLRAEVFDDQLDQSRELLSAGYSLASAVVAGTVLETTLRGACADRGIALPAKPKLDTMNAELVKAGAYGKLTQKQCTACADVRNNAAHGHPELFTDADVQRLIDFTEELGAKLT